MRLLDTPCRQETASGTRIAEVFVDYFRGNLRNLRNL
jgi:hypothetical protein